MNDNSSTTAGSSDDRFGLDDLDQLAQRAVDTVMTLVRRGTALASGVLIFAVVAGIGGFLLGLAALSDGIEKVWIAFGGFFAVVAIGSVLVAMLRLRSVKAGATTLVTEVRSLIGGDVRSERTVIETVESSDGVQNDGVVVMSRQFFSMKDAIGGRVDQFKTLASALSAVTSFPGLIAMATVISFVFFGLSVIFLLALAL